MSLRVLLFCAVCCATVSGRATVPVAGAPTNRLSHESSPYLRQHASNPVDWYPWGPEAFARARAENKLIFLSIGYSTCHWCHVMARESFADAETAALLNANFICIKVDREERPDVDRVYQTFVQATTGGGGWPLTVWLAPDLKPVFGGTYFPRKGSAGQPALNDVSTRLAELWRRTPEKLTAQAGEVWQALVAETRTRATDAGNLAVTELRRRCLEQARDSFDAKHGGFEGAPKFPSPVLLDFLLDEAATAADPARREQALRMAATTLRALAAGGIRDPLGGGFHRYTVDAAWRVPHFEKMLYDQAQLASTFLTGWQLTADPALRDAAADTLGYVRRRLTAPDGGFYTAEDADSPVSETRGMGLPTHEGKPTGLETRATTKSAEGAFYVWTAKEFEGVLGTKDAALAAYALGVGPAGNTGPDTGAELVGQNVLYRAHSAAECARHFNRSEADVQAALAAAATRLRAAREQRPHPARDDKIVTAWNGLMISAFARAAQVLDDPAHASTAARAAAFLRAHLRDPATGRLSHSTLAGRGDGRGFAEDYAFLIQGLLDLYEATFDVAHLVWAAELQELQDRLFWDESGGGYFASAAGDPDVLLRLKVADDGAEPSPNSVAIRNLARLAAMLHRDDFRARADRTARAFAPQLEQAPFALPQMLGALGWLESAPQQILIQGEPADARTTHLVAEVRRHHRPRGVLLRIDAASRATLESKVEFIRALPTGTEIPPTAYVCENFVCRLPTGDPAVLRRQLTAAKK